jgi:hypothetical protein
MTRSFVAVGHRDLEAALRYHRLGPFLYAFVLLQIPYRGLRLSWRRFAEATARHDFKVNVAVLLALWLLLVANWLARVFGLLA